MYHAIIIIVIVIPVIAVAVAAGMIIMKKKGLNKQSQETLTLMDEGTNIMESSSPSQELFIIKMDMLPAGSIPDESVLVEITDSKVLARVNNLVPGLAQVGNAVNNIAQAVQANGEILYRAIIPAGAKLTDSKAMEGAVRGFYRGADGIKGHANLVAVEARKGTAVLANTAAAAMGVASMVVGQYYMKQINAELETISDGISKIANFQDSEYRSRVFSLIAHVKKIADFQVEILDNDELRLSKIAQLDSLEEECTKLLGQANLTLEGYAKKTDLDYDAYEKELSEAQKWYMYQRSLLDVLYKIADLRYTLHLGAVSREQCVALLPMYTKQVSDTQQRLTKWHQRTTERLDIHVEELRRKRAGLDRVIHFIPGLFNDELNFRSISKSTAKMIESQASSQSDSRYHDTSDLYKADVQLIAKDSKIYYLPLNKEE